jgi:hypothetical protein
LAAEQDDLPAVVEMVSVAVPGVVDVILTGLVAPKLSVGVFTAPDGLVAITAVSVTEPVNPLVGVTVIVEVLPVVAPADRVVVVPAMVNDGCAGVVTVTLVVVDPEKRIPALFVSGT